MFKVGGSTNFSSLNQNVFQSLDLFAQRLNAVNGRKVQNSSKNLNVAEDKKSGCTLTYGEYIQIGGRVASPVYYVAPIINLKGSGKLILEVAPDLPKEIMNRFRKTKTIGQENSLDKTSVIVQEEDDDEASMTRLASDFPDFTSKERHFTVKASCSRFDIQGKYLGRQDATLSSPLPPLHKPKNTCFVGIWPCSVR